MAKLIAKKITHRLFIINIALKGLDGVVEFFGGILLFLTNPGAINHWIFILTREELAEDKSDFIANYLLKSADSLSVSGQHFGGFYLISHGIVKVFLVASLLRQRLWAYPLAIVFLILFIVYQVYRYTFTHSPYLILLTVFDALIVVLTQLEYRRLRAEHINGV